MDTFVIKKVHQMLEARDFCEPPPPPTPTTWQVKYSRLTGVLLCFTWASRRGGGGSRPGIPGHSPLPLPPPPHLVLGTSAGRSEHLYTQVALTNPNLNRLLMLSEHVREKTKKIHIFYFVHFAIYLGVYCQEKKIGDICS